MNRATEHHSTHHKGVICLYCGKSTCLSEQFERRYSLNPHELRALLIRCTRCCKEALYLPEEIVDFQPV